MKALIRPIQGSLNWELFSYLRWRGLFIFTGIICVHLLHAQSQQVAWNQLADGYVIDNFPYIYDEFEYILVNEDTIQARELNCADCPFEIRKTSGPFQFYNDFELTLRGERSKINILKDSKIEVAFRPSSFLYAFWNPRKVSLQLESACDTVSQIVYEELKESFEGNVRSNTEKILDESVDINVLFGKLKQGELRSWLNSFSPESSDLGPADCVEIFELLTYIKQEDMSGFPVNEYTLNGTLEGYLDQVGKAITLYMASYGEGISELNVQVVGYADQRRIAAGQYIPNTLSNVYYFPSTCGSEQAAKLAYSPLNAPRGIRVPYRITNNCQLSALRAYMTTVYLSEKLASLESESLSINYSYAAGGVASGSDFEANRKVNVLLTFQASKKKGE